MTITINSALDDARLGEVVAAAGAGSYIILYGNDKPAQFGGVGVEHTTRGELQAPHWGAVAAGVVDSSPFADVTVTEYGALKWFRVYGPGGVSVLEGTVGGPGSGAGVEVAQTGGFTPGQVVTISSIRLTETPALYDNQSTVSPAVQDARLAVVWTAITTGGGDANVELFTGTRPANGGAAGVGASASFDLAQPDFSAPSDEGYTDTGPRGPESASEAGALTWFRLQDRAGGFILDGSAGLRDSDADLELNTNNIAVSDTIRLSDIVLRERGNAIPLPVFGPEGTGAFSIPSLAVAALAVPPNDASAWAPMLKGLNSGNTAATFRSAAADGLGVWVVVASFGYAARSTDGGLTWLPLVRGLNSGNTAASFQSVATDGLGVWVAVASFGHASRSTDNGATWSPLVKGLNSGSDTVDIFGITASGSVWVSVASSGYCARSADNGATWSPLEQGLNSGSVSAVFDGVCTNGLGVWVAVASFGYAARSTDNGLTWGPMVRGLNSGSTSALFTAVDIDATGVLVAVASGGYAARSTDNGLTWSPLVRGLNSGSATGSVLAVATDGLGVWVSGHLSGYASRSTDNGATWLPIVRGLNSGNTTTSILGVGSDSDRVWVAVFLNGYASRSA